MESFFERYRNHLILLAVLAAQIIGLAAQVHRSDTGRNSLDARDGASVRLIRLWADAVVSPPERLIHDSVLGVDGMWSNYIYLQQVRKQNQELEKTIDRLRLEQAALLEDARQGQRLQALLGFQESYIYSTVAAQAFGTSGSDQSKVFYIDKGSADGLSRDMAVISADGIVGKVRDVFPHTAQVLAINDQTSGAGVILESTRIRGILKGDAAGKLEVVGLLADQRIQPGEKVLTAGGDLIFPRGLQVGSVDKVVRDPDRDSFINVMVKPAAHLDQLDEVLIITSTEPRFPANAQQDMAASEALKGADAGALQDQLKASQIMAERLPGLTDPSAAGANPQPSAGTGQTGQAAGGKAPALVAPPPAPKLLPALHPDRFSPAAAPPPSGKQPDANTSRPQPPAGQPSEPRRNP
jgi:rod shape-determining protein MreC